MDKNTIVYKVAELPTIPLGKIADDGEIWEETDGGAHFKITRQPLPIRGNPEFLALSVSGIYEERERIIQEFTDAFGEPVGRTIVSESSRHIDMVSWLVEPTY